MATSGATVEAPRSGGFGRLRGSGLVMGSASVLGVLLLLQLSSETGLLPSDDFPPPTDVISALFDLVGESGFWSAAGATMQGWALGLGLAVAVAVPVGVVLGSADRIYRALRAVIEFLRPIPSVAIIPLAVLIYGSGLQMKVFLVFYACLWPLLIQTIYGVRDVDPVALDTARSFGLGRGAVLRRVTLPSALPYVATGVRIASAIALILAVTAELVVGASGLGKSILVAQSGGAVPRMYALIAVTGILGLLINLVFRQGERRTLHWHFGQRNSEEAA